jgi:protein O-GlcNAc transferase
MPADRPLPAAQHTVGDAVLAEAQRAYAADQLVDCAALLRGALRAQPARAELWALLARVELQRCELDAHDAALDEALRLRPDQLAWRLRAALRCPPMMAGTAQITRVRAEVMDRLGALEAALRARPARIDDPGRQIANLSYYFVYHGEDDRPLHEAMHRVIGLACPTLAARAPHLDRPRPPGPPRVGFSSPHYKDHTIGNLFGGLLPAMDPSAVRRVGLFWEDAVDPRALGWAQGLDEVVLLPRDLPQAMARIAAARLDLLLQLDVGMDPWTALLGHARLARVQATTWGHPVTTGAPQVDLYFSMAAADPPGAQAHFTERLVSLPLPNLCFAAQPQPTVIDRVALGLPPTGRLYGCPQNLFKLHPDFDAALFGVLDADPEGLVLLHGGGPAAWRAALVERLGAQRPDLLPRVCWMGRVPKDRYLAVLAALDVMLDPFPFGGGNTTLEALAVGTPVVTLPPPHLRGRLALAFLQHIGWTDGVAADLGDYVRRAVRLAGPGRAAAQVAMRARAPALFDQPTFVAGLQRALVEAVGAAR